MMITADKNVFKLLKNKNHQEQAIQLI